MYERRFDVELPGIGQVDIDKVMGTIGGAVAAGVGLDMLVSKAAGRWKSNGDKDVEIEEGKES
jgi:hypothetical protein